MTLDPSQPLRVARYRRRGSGPQLAAVHGLSTLDDVLGGVVLEPLVGDLFGQLRSAPGPWIEAADVELLPPVMPGKIVGIGSNYRAHAVELGRKLPVVPKIFLKAPSAVVGPGDAITIPPGTQRVDHEAEVAVVVGRTLCRATEAQAMAAIAGITCLNDVTARDLQKADGVFARGKGFDSFCPLGPWITRGLSPDDLAVRCRVQLADGSWKLRQDGRSSDMVFNTAQLLAFVSAVMTLYPGDVIATGTPAGVGPLQAGQRVLVEVEGVGVLDNPVVDRADRSGAGSS